MAGKCKGVGTFMSLSPGIRVSRLGGKSNKAGPPSPLPSLAPEPTYRVLLVDPGIEPGPLLSLQAWKSSHFLYTAPPSHPESVGPAAATATHVDPAPLSSRALVYLLLFADYDGLLNEISPENLLANERGWVVPLISSFLFLFPLL